jgi:hypothetical protein
MHPQLIYNIIFEDKCAEHLFFNNVHEIFQKALDDWANIGKSLKNNLSITKEQSDVVSILNEERSFLVSKIDKYRSFVQHNNLIFEFNLNNILEKRNFVSAEALHTKPRFELTSVEKDFYEFIDGFIEEIDYKIVRQYSLICLQHKRFDNIPKIQHVLFNR